MRIKIAIIVSLWSVFVFGQTQSNEIPNFTPPSPDASALTKYGDLPMNEFNGTVNYNLPLYNYQASNIVVPISLNYIGASVKVNDLPTWVGINWTLNAGGVITRTAKDIPDEKAETRFLLSETDIPYYVSNTYDGTTKAQELRELLENDNIDTEADIFQFSFGGFSGSFYLDQNMNAQVIKSDSPIKIKPVLPFNTSKAIKITTPDGIIYNFGGLNASEETVMRQTVNGTLDSSETLQGVTAFYLSSIEHPSGGVVNFTYTDNLSTKIVPIDKIEKLRKVIGPLISDQCLNSLPGSQYITTDYISMFSRVVNPKYLTRISSNVSLEEINFISQPVNNANFKRVLNKIIIKNTGATDDDQNNKTINFEYLGFQQTSNPFSAYPDITKRFFLEKVIFDKDNLSSVNTVNGRRNEVYKFVYDSPTSIPERFNFSQDYIGNFNGKTNTTLLPNSTLINPAGVSYYANRYPDFEYASKGTLTHIYYPTSGYTNFEYEPIKCAIKNEIAITLNTRRYMQGEGLSNQISDGVPRIEYDGSITKINNILESQTAQIQFNFTAVPSDSPINIHNERVYYKIKNLTTGVQDIEKIVGMNVASGETSYQYILQYAFNQGHEYEIKIRIDEPTATSSQNPFQVQAIIKYLSGYEPIDGAGVRIKRQTDYSSDGIAQNIKRYYYSAINNINPPASELPIYTDYAKVEKGIYNYICQTGSVGGSPVEFVDNLLFLSSDFQDISSKKGMGQYEKVSVSYGGDNFEKGGIEKTFQILEGYGTVILPTLPNLSYLSYHKERFDENDFLVNTPSQLSGNLIIEKVFKNDSGLKKISQTQYVYDNAPLSSIYNLFAKKLYQQLLFETGSTINNVLSNYFIGQQKFSSFKNELTSKTTKQYIDPVPLTVSDESTYKNIVITENYEYNSLRGLPTKISTIDSEGMANETRNFYPNQASGLSDMTMPYLTSYAKLVSQNRVSSPIQVEQYKAGSLLSMQRTLFKQFGTNPEHVFPEKIQSAKGTANLEDRVLFLSYDPLGNPSVLSYPNGKKTKYFYNSFNKVFMKIDNYIETSTGAGSGPTIPYSEVVVIESNPCDYLSQFPKSQVTLFGYNYTTKMLTSITDPNCKKTKYEYNTLNQLIRIRDNDNNIVKEFDNNFKRY